MSNERLPVTLPPLMHFMSIDPPVLSPSMHEETEPPTSWGAAGGAWEPGTNPLAVPAALLATAFWKTPLADEALSFPVGLANAASTGSRSCWASPSGLEHPVPATAAEASAR